ncbi:MAG: hypothetical protein EOM88_03905 [Clostridia bacterium]|nr:hypothetical protein [Clostridia bacterium]
MAKAKKTNAQVLREIMEINKAYLEENPDAESLLTEKFEQVITDVLNSSDRDDFINVELNRRLKPVHITTGGKK